MRYRGGNSPVSPTFLRQVAQRFFFFLASLSASLSSELCSTSGLLVAAEFSVRAGLASVVVFEPATLAAASSTACCAHEKERKKNGF